MNTLNVLLTDFPSYQEAQYFHTETTKDEDYYSLVYHQLQYLFLNEYFPNKARVFPNILCLKEVDFSTVNPQYKKCDTTSWLESTGKSLNFEENIEYDEVFRLPPKNSYNIKMNIKSIEKPKPKFIEPY